MPLNRIQKQMLDFNAATSEELNAHTSNSSIHTTQAEKDKLAGIEAQANKYVHPANHSPSIITQDANNRFVTDTEKATWNGKADTSSVTTVDNKVNEMRLSGVTASRPVPSYVGQMYFDTTLGKPVYAKVLSPATWVDSAGATV
ncbi:hypothetical protein P4V41_07030 [Fictibacillus nanhaiensis]|uniref:hypothetical protein n=1 Tax=Fictibacillus nanhaiensis TaxID=742169 RepID=UPI002E201C1F|nr:hypothetical protein [Fictibacillus nanhaiensis]